MIKIELTDKITEIEKKMPGISEKLKPYNNENYENCYKREPQDVIYLAHGQYKIAVSKWEQKHWTGGRGGIEFTEWLKVHYSFEGEALQEKETERIVTRHQFHQHLDKPDLMFKYRSAGAEAYTRQVRYDKIVPKEAMESLEVTSAHSIQVWWQDKEGKRGPQYQITLDEKKYDAQNDLWKAYWNALRDEKVRKGELIPALVTGIPSFRMNFEFYIPDEYNKLPQHIKENRYTPRPEWVKESK